MIWPLTRDTLENDASRLVDSANAFAVGIHPEVAAAFPADIPNDVHAIEYWDFIVTIAAVFVALTRLRNLGLPEKRERQLEKIVGENLVRLYPAARPTFEKCKEFYEKNYEALASTGEDPATIVVDVVGLWVTQEVLDHHPEAERERALIRLVGEMIVYSFVNWWEQKSRNS